MVKLLGGEIEKADLLRKIGRIEQVAGARPVKLASGKAEGIKAWEIYNGSGLEFCVMENKCLDLLYAKYRGVNLSFLAKPGAVAPEYFNVHGMEFGRYFHGGMLYTCGLGNIGQSCVDEDTEYNWHGRISQTPAENTGINAEWNGDEYLISVKGDMHEAAHSHEHLVLKRKISTRLGAKSFTICDTVENQGFKREAIMLLYHINFGYPLLDRNTRVVLPTSITENYVNYTKSDEQAFRHITDPVDGSSCDTYFHRPATDASGYTSVAIINDDLRLGVYLRYLRKDFPFMVEWKNMVSGDYALALEPCTQYPLNRMSKEAQKNMQFLDPLEDRTYNLEIGIIDGKEEIHDFEMKLKQNYLVP